MISQASHLEDDTSLGTDAIFEELVVLIEHPEMRLELCTRGTAIDLH
jgi:hypothetical protein